MFEALIEELTGQTIDVFDEALAAAKRKRDEAELEIAAITALVDSTQAFHDHADRSVNGYLKQQLNCSATEARRIKRRAALQPTSRDRRRAVGESHRCRSGRSPRRRTTASACR